MGRTAPRDDEVAVLDVGEGHLDLSTIRELDDEPVISGSQENAPGRCSRARGRSRERRKAVVGEQHAGSEVGRGGEREDDFVLADDREEDAAVQPSNVDRPGSAPIWHGPRNLRLGCITQAA